MTTYLTLAASAFDDLQVLQRTRKWILRALFGFTLIPIVFVDSYWHEHAHSAYSLIERMGAVAILCCIFGRTWCSLYIAGRKKQQLVMDGPYSLVRNPLYVFTIVGAVGMGAQSGSVLVVAWFGVVTFLVFQTVARREEDYLARRFPNEYRAYADRVDRFLPRFRGWRDCEELVVWPRLVLRTFAEGCLLLGAIPAADLLEILQRTDVLPTLMRLP
jgi:protein-S-isoprenylcysteine O-methyltransferase Ste14